MSKKFNPKSLKQLASSRCADLATKPGRLPTPSHAKAFLRRVREAKMKQGSDRILAASRLVQHQQWARTAGAALLALQLLLGQEATPNQVFGGIKKSRRPRSHGEFTPDQPQASEMLQALLEFLHSAAAPAIVAHLILEEGELKADRKRDTGDTRRRRLPDERPAELWANPTFPNDNPVIRLPR